MISIRRCEKIAKKVTRDLDLDPPLRVLDVEEVVDPNADSFLGKLQRYDLDLRATIESRILQEVDD